MSHFFAFGCDLRHSVNLQLHYTTRANPAPKLLPAKGLLQSRHRNVPPSQIDDWIRVKNRKVKKNGLHVLELQTSSAPRFLRSRTSRTGSPHRRWFGGTEYFQFPRRPPGRSEGCLRGAAAHRCGIGRCCSRLETVAMLITNHIGNRLAQESGGQKFGRIENDVLHLNVEDIRWQGDRGHFLRASQGSRRWRMVREIVREEFG